MESENPFLPHLEERWGFLDRNTNPWFSHGGQQVVLVTGAEIKTYLAKECGIRVEEAEDKRMRVGKNEHSFDRSNGFDRVLVPYYILTKEGLCMPYLSAVAMSKGDGIVGEGHEHFHAFTDSGWVVWRNPKEGVVINKPKGEEEKEETLRFFSQVREGARLTTDTGIAIYPSKDVCYLYILRVELGSINPDFSFASIEKLMSAQPNVAGGMDIFQALNTGVVRLKDGDGIPCTLYGVEFPSGALVPLTRFEIAYDPANYEILRAVSLGFLPTV